MSFFGYPSTEDMGWWRISQLVPPPLEPVTLAESKQFARIEYSDDDALVQDLITSSREYAETYQKRAIPTQVFQIFSLGFPWSGGYYNRIIRALGPNPWWLPTAQGIIRLPHPLVQMVLSVQYIDPSSGLVDYVPPSQYIFSYNSVPGQLMPIYGAVWPLARPQIDAVSITYVAGYGPSYQGQAQSQTLAMQGLAQSGTFTLSFNGDTTSALNWNCTAAQVQTALQSLGNVGVGNATCIGGPFPVAPVIVQWAGTMATGYQPQITATSNISGLGQPAVLTNTPLLMPSSTRTAIKQIVADSYENRESSLDVRLMNTPVSDRMLNQDSFGSYV